MYSIRLKRLKYSRNQIHSRDMLARKKMRRIKTRKRNRNIRFNSNYKFFNRTKIRFTSNYPKKLNIGRVRESLITDGSKLDSTSQQHVNRLLGSIKNTGSATQLAILRKLIENHPFNLHQLRSLRTTIDDRIKLDIISGVPYEIALYIMSFLGAKDLCQAAQTCRSWRNVCEDNRLWREKCKEEGLLDDEQTLEALFKERMTSKHNRQEKIVNDSLSKLPKSDYKIAYLKHMNILRNWRTRKFEISEPFIASNLLPTDQTQRDSRLEGLNTSSPINSPFVALRRPAAHALAGISGENNSRANNKSLAQNLNEGGENDRNDDVRSIGDNGASDGCADNGDSISPPASSCSMAEDNWATTSTNNLMQLRCHEDSVITCLQFNPTTNTIVSGSDDQTLKVWSSETGRCITTLEGHAGGVWSSQLSPEDIVISGSTDRTIKVWKAHTGELLHTLYGHTSTVRCLALSGDKVVSGSRDTTLRLWNIVTGECVLVFLGHSAAVRCVEYKNDIIVSGAYDTIVMVWDALTGACCHALECHFSRIYSLQFDGKIIASGSLDSTICIWDAATGKLRHQLEGHQSLTSKMQLKGNLLVSANADSFCKVWNINTGECLQTLGGESKHTSAITSVYFNNRHVVTSSDDGTVKLWDIKTGKLIRDLVVLPTASRGGVVWRIRASYTKLICAIGSRILTEDTHLLVLDFNE